MSTLLSIWSTCISPNTLALVGPALLFHNLIDAKTIKMSQVKFDLREIARSLDKRAHEIARDRLKQWFKRCYLL